MVLLVTVAQLNLLLPEFVASLHSNIKNMLLSPPPPKEGGKSIAWVERTYPPFLLLRQWLWSILQTAERLCHGVRSQIILVGLLIRILIFRNMTILLQPPAMRPLISFATGYFVCRLRRITPHALRKETLISRLRKLYFHVLRVEPALKKLQQINV